MSNVIYLNITTDHLAHSEADHRIANNLSVISSLVRLKAQHGKVDDPREFLTDVAGRIDTVAQLHRLLAHASNGRVPAARFLRDVCTALKGIAASDDQVHVAIECRDTVTLSPESALRLGLLTAELFSNSLKYAHPTGLATHIRVRCRQDRGTIDFSFADDGVGLPENFDPVRSDSLGMHILHALANELDGTCEWRDLGIGLAFVCRFPEAVDRNRS